MAELVYVAARRAAEELLQAYWDGQLPVKLGPITDALDAIKRDSFMDPQLSGIVAKTPAQPANIVINLAESPARQRFTWAHELGHIVERAQIGNDDDYSFTDTRGAKYDLHEFYADEFAGALLMPVSEIKRMQQNGTSTPVMARKFGVSVPAMERRLQGLQKNPA